MRLLKKRLRWRRLLKGGRRFWSSRDEGGGVCGISWAFGGRLGYRLLYYNILR